MKKKTTTAQKAHKGFGYKTLLLSFKLGESTRKNGFSLQNFRFFFPSSPLCAVVVFIFGAW
jgi:hypothetical protein